MAMSYPIGRVFDEARLVVDRKNGELATVAMIIHSATLATGMGASKKAGDHFQKLVKTLSGDTQ